MIRSLAFVDETITRNMSAEKLETLIGEEVMVWVDLVDPTEDELDWAGDVFDLHPNVQSDLRRDDRRPTLITFEDYLFLSLFQAVLKDDAIKSTEIHCLCFQQGAFVTVRGSESQSVGDAYEVAARNESYWKQGVEYFLYLCIQHVIDSYYPRLDRISLRLAAFEEEILKGSATVSEGAAYRIKQQLIKLRQMVAPQREVLSNLIGEGQLSNSTEARELYHHLYERILRIYDIIDAQRDLWSNAMELIRSRETAVLTRTVNRLTIVSIIFLPLTLLLSLFELDFYTTQTQMVLPLSGELFLVALLVSGMVLMGFMYLLYKRIGWW